jgi:capsular exopolysaccharide synthesis family protein
LPQGPGISEVLAGEVDFAVATQELAIDGLSVLSAGDCTGNPSERLSSARLGTLLEEAGRRFDIVLIDTPPLLSFSDPCVVAGKVDGLVLVLRIDQSSRAAVERATELLETYGFPVLGVVANAADDDADEEFSCCDAAPPQSAAASLTDETSANSERCEEPALT